MSQCCTRGLVGKFKGERVFCDCREGLDAEMNAASANMSDMAQIIVELDSTEKLVPLSEGEELTRALAKLAFNMWQAKYDRLEQQFNEKGAGQ